MTGVRAPGWEAPVTVTELVNAGTLAGARMYGAGENPVRGVRIVDELSVLGTVAPHTAVVLIGTAASGGWAVEMAMRRAWEQAAACVIAPSAGLSESSGEVLAERLGITLIFVDEDPLLVAVRVASAASRPDAARMQLVARCATRLAEAGTSARRVLGVLNAELPGTSVAFLDRHGLLLAGRRDAAAGGRPEGEEAIGGWSAQAEVPDQEGGVLGTLVAGGSSRSPGWPSVVRTVLSLAVAPLTAWAARERLRACRDFARQASLAERLLAEAATTEADLASADGTASASATAVPEEEAGAVRMAAVALGWPVRGPLTGYQVRPASGAGDAALAQTLITAALGQVPVTVRGEGWAGWSALDPAELTVRLERCLPTMPWPCSAGVGAQVPGLEAAGESLTGAEAAAAMAGPGTVARADEMGPAELLGALPSRALRAPATVILRPLLTIDRDGTLLETLAAVLDEGGALKAAERLGVHRNTVTTRLDRIKAAGFDLDDPATRLALQLACHVMLR
ncbi:PucR family transcriptional regulator [Nonomuraea terrae]|uniref:PucR family transcriptional regulator n=1 Tax=Nonomuraea terrae TaxID=2530383 RepID=A0A4R4YQS3_9ACTN|nr:helix-turn-helix domain-containing protein [Nonomuraea terrae]TDD46664.1 PucR family transcriptional regulator [Nonomuraea terrae]